MPWAKSLQLCPSFCDSMNCSPPGSSVHGILQARILEWVAMPFSRGSSRPRDQTRVFCTADESLPSEPQRKPNKGFRVIQGKSLKRWLWPTLQAPVPSLSSLHLSLKSSPSSFHPILLPTTHYTVHLRILCTERPVFFFTICPQALPLAPADADTRRPLASGVAGDPGAQSFKLFDLSTQDLRGCSPTKIKFIWPWKFGLDWHDREERFFFFPMSERVQTKLQKQTCQSISSQRVRSESRLISKKQRSAPPWMQGLKKFCFVQPARGVMNVLRSEWLRDQSASGKLIRWCYGLGPDMDGIESRKKKSVRSY